MGKRRNAPFLKTASGKIRKTHYNWLRKKLLEPADENVLVYGSTAKSFIDYDAVAEGEDYYAKKQINNAPVVTIEMPPNTYLTGEVSSIEESALPSATVSLPPIVMKCGELYLKENTPSPVVNAISFSIYAHVFDDLSKLVLDRLKKQTTEHLIAYPDSRVLSKLYVGELDILNKNIEKLFLNISKDRLELAKLLLDMTEAFQAGTMDGSKYGEYTRARNALYHLARRLYADFDNYSFNYKKSKLMRPVYDSMLVNFNSFYGENPYNFTIRRKKSVPLIQKKDILAPIDKDGDLSDPQNYIKKEDVIFLNKLALLYADLLRYSIIGNEVKLTAKRLYYNIHSFMLPNYEVYFRYGHLVNAARTLGISDNEIKECFKNAINYHKRYGEVIVSKNKYPGCSPILVRLVKALGMVPDRNGLNVYDTDMPEAQRGIRKIIAKCADDVTAISDTPKFSSAVDTIEFAIRKTSDDEKSNDILDTVFSAINDACSHADSFMP
jgi:hypothetical protein